jgi:hypothetical protein
MQPESQLTYNGFWDTEEAAKAAHTGIYASYRNYDFTFWRMGEVRSDIWGGNTFANSPNDIDLIENNISTSMFILATGQIFTGCCTTSTILLKMHLMYHLKVKPKKITCSVRFLDCVHIFITLC